MTKGQVTKDQVTKGTLSPAGPGAAAVDALEQRPQNRRFGWVALVGLINAGKSSLFNELAGHSWAAVTHKAQTTQASLATVLIEGASQLVLADTPGVLLRGGKLPKLPSRALHHPLEQADIVVVVIDSARRNAIALNKPVFETLGAAARPSAILALNKIDCVHRPALLPLCAEACQEFPFDEVFMLSCRTGDGVGDLRSALAARAPPGAWRYADRQGVLAEDASLAAELTREQILRRIHQEIPYSVKVTTDHWKQDRKGTRLAIEQTIWVAKERHKGILRGTGGSTLAAITRAARARLGNAFGREIQLTFHLRKRPRSQGESR